jgi:hypothetical protein
MHAGSDSREPHQSDMVGVAVLGALSTLVTLDKIVSEWNTFNMHHRFQAGALVLGLLLLPISIVRSIGRNQNIELMLATCLYAFLMVAVTTFGK